jgi:two-component sensor histidine kinase
LNKILNIGLEQSIGLSLQEIKIRRLFNGLTSAGILISVLHFLNFLNVDLIAGLLHLTWGVLCVFALWVNSRGYYKQAKILTSYSVILLGYTASARIGWEVYPHFPSFGILVAAFIFFSDKSEIRHWVFILILAIIGTALVESNILKNESVHFENEELMRFFNFSGTIVFVAFEILFLVRLGQVNESKMNAQLKKSNTELKESNEQKNILIQEIHHRVKNNLQVIISLLKLHSTEISDEKALEMIKNFKKRLISISVMHEMMYTSDQVGKVDFKKYVEELADNMVISSKKNIPVYIVVESDVSKIRNSSIVPLALIIHELMSNSFKHAFNTELKKGEIYVELKKAHDDYILTYKDNGKWNEEAHKNFGTELLELLTQQLSGKTIVTPNAENTIYEIKLCL